MPLETNETGGYKFTCDQCGAPDMVWWNTMAFLIEQAQASGWHIEHQGDTVQRAVCPKCAGVVLTNAA